MAYILEFEQVVTVCYNCSWEIDLFGHTVCFFIKLVCIRMIGI